jgi:Fur family transcriptional regulator, ferric uptake regulator
MSSRPRQTQARTTTTGRGDAPDLATLRRLCAEKGLRVTEQRRIILQVIAGADDYPDIEELHRRAARLDPRISLATIYRNVRLFQELGILERHDFLNGRARYEASPAEHHDHLIDVRSGRVIEFQSPEIERLQADIARTHGYRIVDHRLEIYVVPLQKDDETG